MGSFHDELVWLPRIRTSLLGVLLSLTLLACSSAGGDGQDGVDACADLICGENASCTDGSCACEDGFADCDGDDSNGCETPGACLCEFGVVTSCYDGPAGTEGIGVCSSGTRTCLGTEWSECEGQSLPSLELCEANGEDEDCDGQVDEDEDEDGDGWGRCAGDCCDSLQERCAEDPALVNPGAYDFPDNEVDDDCDGIEDNVVATDCSALAVTAGAADDAYARQLVEAMDLCQFVEADADSWGVVSHQLLRTNGQPAPSPLQVGVLSSLGGVVPAIQNETMAVMSSGIARGVDDPGYTGDSSYSADFTSVSVPAVYTNAHGGQLQSAPECQSGEPNVYDSVLLRLRIRVPTNAQGFEFKFRFFSHEYPQWLCSQFNDFFLVLLASQHPDIPADANISFDSAGNPVSVNNAFFTSCQALECYDPNFYGMMSGPDVAPNDGCVDTLTCNTTTNLCEGAFGACPDGAGDVLAYDTQESGAGATAWLTTSAPVIPGETIWLDFHIWDTGDSALDSLVLVDDFQWLIEPTEVITKL
ncbi:MAG: choice-of-anchor L domain-containing protein [Myxococcota bacterium]|nr:choice-of-anchor L domain-containing protein [Myxococcota bacterium]